MKGDFISCCLLLQPTLRNVSCEKLKLRPNNGIIAQLSKCTQVVRWPLLYLLFYLSEKGQGDSRKKPDKDPSLAANYRPISLLSVCYKLLERLALQRISPTVEGLLSPD